MSFNQITQANANKQYLVTAHQKGIWTPSESAKVNLTGTGTFNSRDGAKWELIGNKVIATIPIITGYSTTSAGVATRLQISTNGLPYLNNTKDFYVSGGVFVSAIGTGIGGAFSSDANQDVDIFYQAPTTGSTSFYGLRIEYYVDE